MTQERGPRSAVKIARSGIAGCLLVAVASFASEPSPELTRVLERMADAGGVEVSFVEHKELSLLAAPLESSGVIYFVPPDRFARFTLSPGFTSLVVSGEDVHLREGSDGDDVDLSGNAMARVFVENFVVLWSGDRERLERLYEPDFRSEAGRWELRLVPRRRPLSSVIAVITLSGDAVGMQEMRIDELDGDRTTTVFGVARSDRVFAPAEIERIFGAGKPLEGAAAEP